MRKLLTIIVTILFLSGIMHLTVAIHYCGGEISETRISVNGKMASCGMHHENTTSSEASVSLRCCDDETMVYKFDDEYAPSVLKPVTPGMQNVSLQPPAGFSFHYLSFFSPGDYIDSGPQNISCPNSVSIERICSYLI